MTQSRSPEINGIPVQSIVVIDESHPENILSDPQRGLDFLRHSKDYNKSLEGFAGNHGRQRLLAQRIARMLQIARRGAVLDVGLGKNLSFASGFTELGIPAFGIDPREDPGWKKLNALDDMGRSTAEFWHVPQRVTTYNGISIFDGDVALLGDENSELKAQKFGLIVFKGSWSSPGNNFTVEGRQRNQFHIYEGELRRELLDPLTKSRPPTPYDYRWENYNLRVGAVKQEIERRLADSTIVQDGKSHVLRTCLNHLTDTGMIGIVSSRYAYHGAGYFFEDLPAEKQEFEWLYNQFINLGAIVIYLVGMSHGGFDHAFNIPPNAIPIDETGREVSKLLDQSRRDAVRRALFEHTTPDGFDKLARIDAIFVEFKAA